MQPLVQRFEFSYGNGELFWDRSGQLAIALRELMPNLRATNSGADQRDLTDDQAKIELFYGIAAASFMDTLPGSIGFPALAAKFMRLVATTFELGWLRKFSCRYVAGQRCATRQEAADIFSRLIDNEGNRRLEESGLSGDFIALQLEFRQGAVDVRVRYTTENLVGDPSTPTISQPHALVIIDATGQEPIELAEFDAEAFMNNVIGATMERIDAKLQFPGHE